mmetsp:Transcript_105479/g.280890  ORF Transcript_105479/g.280890 Transcript_105479/m.280890 type:complete len:224 (-) Transcript_105479:497-1168(-)
MAVGKCEVAALHVVERDGRVDDEAQKAGSYKVPEGNVDEAVDNGHVPFQPRMLGLLGGFVHRGVLAGLEAHERQWAHLERGEAGADGDDGRWRAREVEVVEHAGDTSKEEDACCEESHTGSTLGLEHLEPHKDVGGHHGDEDLEEALHPHVHDPEAPVVHHGEVAARVIHEASAVEETDQGRRAHQHHGEVPPPVALVVRAGREQCRPDAVDHEQEPDDESDE